MWMNDLNAALEALKEYFGTAFSATINKIAPLDNIGIGFSCSDNKNYVWCYEDHKIHQFKMGR